MLMFETVVKISTGTMFAVRMAVAHWFDSNIDRDECVHQASEAIAKHMRQTGQSAEGLTRGDIAEALFARDYSTSHAPTWFDCSDEPVDLAEDIGEAVLELLAPTVAA